MPELIVVQHSESHSHADAVVRPQGGAPGADLVPRHEDVQTHFLRVPGAVVLLLHQHVHVSLEHDRRRVLVAGGGVLPDNDVVHLVPAIPETPLPGEGHHVVADGSRVPGPVGKSAQILEESKHRFRLQAG